MQPVSRQNVKYERPEDAIDIVVATTHYDKFYQAHIGTFGLSKEKCLAAFLKKYPSAVQKESALFEHLQESVLEQIEVHCMHGKYLEVLVQVYSEDLKAFKVSARQLIQFLNGSIDHNDEHPFKFSEEDEKMIGQLF